MSNDTRLNLIRRIFFSSNWIKSILTPKKYSVSMLHEFCPITPHQTGPAQDMHFGLHACVYTSQGLSYSKRWSVP